MGGREGGWKEGVGEGERGRGEDSGVARDKNKEVFVFKQVLSISVYRCNIIMLISVVTNLLLSVSLSPLAPISTSI